MTTVGGLGHTMPFLVPNSWPNAFWIATAIAAIVVFFELWAIAYIRARYMDTPFLQAVFQIVLGGVIVLAVGILHWSGVGRQAMMKRHPAPRFCRQLCLLAGAAVAALAAQPAMATDEIQVYNAGIAAPGQFTIQQHLNYVPLGVKDPPFPGGLISHNSVNGTPEFAYGVMRGALVARRVDGVEANQRPQQLDGLDGERLARRIHQRRHRRAGASTSAGTWRGAAGRRIRARS